MKTKYLMNLAAAALILLLGVVSTQAQGTAFTYQGRLDGTNGPVNGQYDFQFNLYGVASAGTPLTGGITLNAQPVANGLFTVTLDFGNQFPGADRWLEISTRTNGAAAFSTLSPRQKLTPTPYAITAGNVSGTVPASQLTGTIAAGRLPANVVTNFASGVSLTGTFTGTLTGNGAGLTGLPAGQLTGSIADARLSANVALRNGGNAFTGNQTLAGGGWSFLDANASLTYPPVGGANSPMIHMFASGAGNADRMVLAHSPTFSNWGLQYQDNGDRFNFLASGSPVLSVGLESRNVGVGLANPAGKLVVQGDTGSVGSIVSFSVNAHSAVYGENTSGTGAGVAGRSSGSAHAIYGDNSSPNGWAGYFTGRLFAGNRIGIGTENPDTSLSIVGAGAANEWISFKSADQITRWHLNNRNGGLNFARTGIADGRLFLGTNGNVGIGTDAPQARLHIYGAENPATIRLQSSAGPGFGRLEFYSDPLGALNEWRPGYIQSIDNGGFTGGMRFVSNIPGSKFGEIEAMRVVAGRVGMGAGNPTAKLHVIADANLDAIHAVCSSPLTAVYGNNTSGGGFGVTGVASGSGTAVLGSNPDPAGLAGYFDGNVRVTGTTTTGILTITGGADLAEPFKMSAKDLPKGAVVVIDDANPGHLKLSEGAYDTRVAGIISGAGGVNPGISLSQHGVMEGDQNVALSGRVYVQADASPGAIKPGDLLTTSDVPGHAMKVSDATRSQGAILGKAMTSLKDGKGLVLVLVTLQ